MQNINRDLLYEVVKAVNADKKKTPWPVHVVAQASRVNEPAGTLLNASLLTKYEVAKTDDKKFLREMLRGQAIGVIARAIRFIDNLEELPESKQIELTA